MEQASMRFFEEFDEAPREADESSLPGLLTIRPARARDVDSLGRLSADREGGDALTHSVMFRRAIESDESGGTSLILVAEVQDDVRGFGKVRYLSRERGTDVSESPEGWYLTGVVVDPGFRRRGAGSRLTAQRLQWIAERNRFAYYLSNAGNRVSISLHESFGFSEIARGPEFGGVSFMGGEGILFRADLSGLAGLDAR